MIPRSRSNDVLLYAVARRRDESTPAVSDTLVGGTEVVDALEQAERESCGLPLCAPESVAVVKLDERDAGLVFRRGRNDD